MLNYLEKFKQLSPDIREKVSGAEAMEEIKALEAEYGVSLATAVMRVAVREIPFSDLAQFFEFEKGLEKKSAEELAVKLKDKIFDNIGDYLGFEKEKAPAFPSMEEEDSEGSLLQWIQSRKKEIKSRDSKGSNFFFSPDDEDEVKQFSQKIENFKKDENLQKPPEPNFEEVIKVLMGDLGLSFSSEDLKKRFYGIIKTYLKGVRNKIDTKQALSRDINSGGMGFTDIYADNILILADKAKKQAGIEELENRKEKESVQKTENEKRPIDIPAQTARDQDYDFKNMPKIEKKDLSGDKNETTDPTVPLPVPEKKLQKIRIPENTVKEKEAEAGKPADNKDIKIEAHQPAPPSRLNLREDKPRMEDVKHVPKLVGPIEELREMDLTSFRRLDPDTRERSKKILDKISFLEEESYSRRLEGIRSWRKSPVNRVYLEIGRKSIGAKQGINDIIKGLRDKGEDCLTEDEFMAIMELNKQLRY